MRRRAYGAEVYCTALPVVRSAVSKYALLSLRDRYRAFRRDRENRKEYGANAPIFGEEIWVAPSEIAFQLVQNVGRKNSGLVQGGDWDISVEPLLKNKKMEYCRLRWSEGLSWEDAGAYAYMDALIARRGSADGCKTHEDVVRRFEELDRIYARVRRDGSLQATAVSRPGSFRACGGIYIHLDRKGKPVFGKGGHHRLAIALALDLPIISAQIGQVHQNALEELWRYRQEPIE